MKTYLHPETGAVISRQRFQQIQNNLRGMCSTHKRRKVAPGSKTYCAQCLEKAAAYRNSTGYQSRADKFEMWKSLDWNKSNLQLSIETGKCEGRVSQCRKIWAPWSCKKKLPFPKKPRGKRGPYKTAHVTADKKEYMRRYSLARKANREEKRAAHEKKVAMLAERW